MMFEAAPIVLIMLTSISASVGNSLLKVGAAAAGKSEAQSLQARHLPGTLRQPAILAGIAVYGISQLLWITVLRLLDLSLAYPLQIGLNFTLIMFAAWFYFHEPVSRGKVLGVGMIFAGIVVISTS